MIFFQNVTKNTHTVLRMRMRMRIRQARPQNLWTVHPIHHRPYCASPPPTFTLSRLTTPSIMAFNFQFSEETKVRRLSASDKSLIED